MPETEEEFQAICLSSVQAGAIQHLELEKVCGSSSAMPGWSADILENKMKYRNSQENSTQTMDCVPCKISMHFN